MSSVSFKIDPHPKSNNPFYLFFRNRVFLPYKVKYALTQHKVECAYAYKTVLLYNAFALSHMMVGNIPIYDLRDLIKEHLRVFLAHRELNIYVLSFTLCLYIYFYIHFSW